MISRYRTFIVSFGRDRENEAAGGNQTCHDRSDPWGTAGARIPPKPRAGLGRVVESVSIGVDRPATVVGGIERIRAIEEDFDAVIHAATIGVGKERVGPLA